MRGLCLGSLALPAAAKPNSPFPRHVPPFAEYHTFLSSERGIKTDTGLCCGLAVFRMDVAS